MDIAYVSPRKEVSKHLLFSVPSVLGPEPEPHEMQASAPLNYSPCLFFFGGRGRSGGHVLCSSVGICNLPASVSEYEDSTPVLPHLGRVSSLTLESPPSQKSLSLPHQLVSSKA